MSNYGNKLSYSTKKATVLYVEDGDTVVVDMNGKKKTIRLSGIDAPELRHDGKDAQPYAYSGKETLKKLLPRGEPVDVLLTGWDDQYDRYIGLVNHKNISVNAVMVGLGLAEVYREYLEDLPKGYADLLLRMEFIAKDKKRGIWNLADYERPITHRKTEIPER